MTVGIPTVHGGWRRSSRRLADGREIIYFDDSEPYVSGAAERTAVDLRQLGPAAVAGEMRYDALTGEWVAIAAHRQDRTFLPPADACPLCPTRPDHLPSEVPESTYDVVVFENRFPSFAGQVDDMVVAAPGLGGGWGRVEAAHGRCEVVCFTADHGARFADLTASRARTVIEAWVDRTSELSALPLVEQVFAFENRGPEIGVSLHHPHGQIYAYPYVTPYSRRMLDLAEAYRSGTGRSLLRDVLDAERADGSRIVLSGEHWTAYVPHAARWPVEVHLAPHRDVPDLPALTDAERSELATVYLELLRRLDRYYTAPDGGEVSLPYIAAWHQAPVRERRELGRLHLQVTTVLRSPGRLKYLAGSESAMGAWVNDTVPERVAARLREIAS